MSNTVSHWLLDTVSNVHLFPLLYFFSSWTTGQDTRCTVSNVQLSPYFSSIQMQIQLHIEIQKVEYKTHDLQCPMSSLRLTSPQYNCKYNQPSRIPPTLSFCSYVTLRVPPLYLVNQAWYHRSAGVKHPEKNSE